MAEWDRKDFTQNLEVKLKLELSRDDEEEEGPDMRARRWKFSGGHAGFEEPEVFAGFYIVHLDHKDGESLPFSLYFTPKSQTFL